MQLVQDIGENALVDRLTALVGIDELDDCAVIEREDSDFLELLKVDCVVEGIHFLPDTEPERVGWKALCRAISDIAAMGGKPEYALVNLLLPLSTPVAKVEGWYRGMQRAAREFDVAIVGGETASAEVASISVSLTGRAEKSHCILRSGARPGDLIAVTGKLGGSFESGRHLDFRPRLEESHWLVENASPSAMMDLSDGLAKDMPRLARASGVDFVIDRQALPLHDECSIEQALTDGEDYELLVTLPEAVEGMPLTIIGKCVESGAGESLGSGGWEHFSVEHREK